MRSVLVTGASTGIGEATAIHLDQRGWRVFAGVRRPVDGDRLRSAASDRLTPVQLDVTDQQQIDESIGSIAETLDGSGLDGLVNNAGVALGGPIEILPLDHWRKQFEVNVVGQVAVTKAALPLLRTAVGRVIFISSISGRVAPGFLCPYAASKYAIEAVGMSLRHEISPWGMRVAIIEPGVIDTPMWDKEPAVDEFEREVGTEGFQLYWPYLSQIQEHIAVQRHKGSPVSEATSAIEHALTAKHPKHRYLVGKDAKITGTLYHYLPDRVYGKVDKLTWRFRT